MNRDEFLSGQRYQPGKVETLLLFILFVLLIYYILIFVNYSLLCFMIIDNLSLVYNIMLIVFTFGGGVFLLIFLLQTLYNLIARYFCIFLYSL